MSAATMLSSLSSSSGQLSGNAMSPVDVPIGPTMRLMRNAENDNRLILRPTDPGTSGARTQQLLEDIGIENPDDLTAAMVLSYCDLKAFIEGGKPLMVKKKILPAISSIAGASNSGTGAASSPGTRRGSIKQASASASSAALFATMDTGNTPTVTESVVIQKPPQRSAHQQSVFTSKPHWRDLCKSLLVPSVITQSYRCGLAAQLQSFPTIPGLKRLDRDRLLCEAAIRQGWMTEASISQEKKVVNTAGTATAFNNTSSVSESVRRLSSVRPSIASSSLSTGVAVAAAASSSTIGNGKTLQGAAAPPTSEAPSDLIDADGSYRFPVIPLSMLQLHGYFYERGVQLHKEMEREAHEELDHGGSGPGSVGGDGDGGAKGGGGRLLSASMSKPPSGAGTGGPGGKQGSGGNNRSNGFHVDRSSAGATMEALGQRDAPGSLIFEWERMRERYLATATKQQQQQQQGGNGVQKKKGAVGSDSFSTSYAKMFGSGAGGMASADFSSSPASMNAASFVAGAAAGNVSNGKGAHSSSKEKVPPAVPSTGKETWTSLRGIVFRLRYDRCDEGQALYYRAVFAPLYSGRDITRDIANMVCENIDKSVIRTLVGPSGVVLCPSVSSFGPPVIPTALRVKQLTAQIQANQSTVQRLSSVVQDNRRRKSVTIGGSTSRPTSSESLLPSSSVADSEPEDPTWNIMTALRGLEHVSWLMNSDKDSHAADEDDDDSQEAASPSSSSTLSGDEDQGLRRSRARQLMFSLEEWAHIDRVLLLLHEHFDVMGYLDDGVEYW